MGATQNFFLFVVLCILEISDTQSRVCKRATGITLTPEINDAINNNIYYSIKYYESPSGPLSCVSNIKFALIDSGPENSNLWYFIFKECNYGHVWVQVREDMLSELLDPDSQLMDRINGYVYNVSGLPPRRFVNSTENNRGIENLIFQ